MGLRSERGSWIIRYFEAKAHTILKLSRPPTWILRFGRCRSPRSKGFTAAASGARLWGEDGCKKRVTSNEVGVSSKHMWAKSQSERFCDAPWKELEENLGPVPQEEPQRPQAADPKP